MAFVAIIQMILEQSTELDSFPDRLSVYSPCKIRVVWAGIFHHYLPLSKGIRKASWISLSVFSNSSKNTIALWPFFPTKKLLSGAPCELPAYPAFEPNKSVTDFTLVQSTICRSRCNRYPNFRASSVFPCPLGPVQVSHFSREPDVDWPAKTRIRGFLSLLARCVTKVSVTFVAADNCPMSR